VAVVAPLLATLAGAVVVGCVLFNVVVYVGAARHRRRHPAPCPEDADDAAPWPARFTAFLAECAVTIALACTVPLALRRTRVRALDDRPGRRPVVFLHGYAQHTANFLWLMRRLRGDGWTHLYSVRHTAARGDIERSADRFGAALDRIRHETGADSVDVVAHSMGGLVARAYVRRRGRGSGIARLVTLGTPHQGTLVLPAFRRDPMVAQMRPTSPFLARLAQDDPVPTLVDCIAIYSADDAVVVPPSAGYWAGAFNIELRGLGHMSLLFSRRVHELVRENLAAPLAAAARALRPA
jgi:triacylglycerol esterase/lipase EstA (alpha/beta hydrolase family)